MADQAGRHLSPWLDTMTRPDLGDTGFREGAGDGGGHVVVVGAGVTGLTTAVLLQRAGLRVTVVEADRLGSSVTTHSTVKVTYAHGAIYSKIADRHGFDVAAAYADANVRGLAQVLDLARDLGIDCDLEHGPPHVVYTEDAEETGQLEAEAAVARRLGLPVTLDQQAPLPFPVAAALHVEDQAQFHPGRYLAGLADAFVRAGGTLIEGVRVQGVDEHVDSCAVQTPAGPLAASHVVVATHYPVLNRGGQFAHLKVRRSYGVAGVLPEATQAGMTINVGSPTRSTRVAELDGQRLLVVVGEGHEVGHVAETAERWLRLQQWARDRFGVSEFRYHWSAQETSSVDLLPFVGFIAPGSRRVLTATGFDGWGMTNGTASAILLRDLILGEDNPWASVFDARRAETTIPGAEFVKHNVHVAKTWVKGRVGGDPPRTPQDLQPGDAGIVDLDGEQTAAYRDEQGGLHAVSAVCTHMKCTVQWNAGERSWDCPCHGSRFDTDGAVLHGPATTPLRRRDVDGVTGI